MSEKDRIISWNSLNHFFNSDSLGKKPKLKTLDILSEYCGYQTFSNFKKFNHGFENSKSESISKNNSNEDFHLTPAEDISMDKLVQDFDITQAENISNDKPNEDISTKQNHKYILVAITILIFSGWVIITKLINRNINDEYDKDKIVKLIVDANNLEFSLYSQLPSLKDTIMLKKFYTTNGTAKSNIIEVLLRSKRKSRILDTSESYRRLNDKLIEIALLNPNLLEVKTIEYWKIVWRVNNIIDAEYDVANNQTYRLIKVDEKWKIDENVFAGKVNNSTE